MGCCTEGFRKSGLIEGSSTKPRAAAYFSPDIFELSSHDCGVSVDFSPILEVDNALVDQQFEPVHNCTAAPFGIFDEMRTR
jgi:hypothetical protein